MYNKLNYMLIIFFLGIKSINFRNSIKFWPSFGVPVGFSFKLTCSVAVALFFDSFAAAKDFSLYRLILRERENGNRNKYVLGGQAQGLTEVIGIDYDRIYLPFGAQGQGSPPIGGSGA
jgi:hypothetical protein